MTAARLDDAFAVVPDPGRARTLDELIEGLRSLKVWAGDPSYEWITSEVNAAWTGRGRQDPASDPCRAPACRSPTTPTYTTTADGQVRSR